MPNLAILIIVAALTSACSATAPTPLDRVEPCVSNWPPRADPPIIGLSGRWEGEAMFVGCPGNCKNFPRPEALRLTVAQTNSDVTGTMQFLGWELVFVGYVTPASGLAGRASAGSTSFDIRLDLAGSQLTGFVASGNFQDPNLRVTERYNITVPLKRQID